MIIPPWSISSKANRVASLAPVRPQARARRQAVGRPGPPFAPALGGGVGQPQRPRDARRLVLARATYP